MPIFEFHCNDCDIKFETLVFRSDESTVCKSCGGQNLQKLISVHAISSGAPDTPCNSAPCSPAPACGGGACPAFK